MSIRDYVDKNFLDSANFYVEEDFSLKAPIKIFDRMIEADIEASCNVYGSGKFTVEQVRICFKDGETDALPKSIIDQLKEEIKSRIESNFDSKIKDLAAEVRAA